MVTLLESLLGKAARWGSWLAEGHGHVQWPENVLDYLEKEFHLLPKEMAALQYVERRRSIGRLHAHFIRVCDRVVAQERGISIRGYRDLDKYPELVLFEGYVLEGGLVHLRKKEIAGIWLASQEHN